MKIELDLMQWKDELSFSNTADGRHIFCHIRKRFLVSTPEELVRQLMIQYLIQKANYSKGIISLEKSISVNGLSRRFDLAVYDSQGNVSILIECKAPTISLSQKTFNQVAAYNLEVKAPFLVITNGLHSYLMLNELPMNTKAHD
jgi:hypothetical protein